MYCLQVIYVLQVMYDFQMIDVLKKLSIACDLHFTGESMASNLWHAVTFVVSPVIS